MFIVMKKIITFILTILLSFTVVAIDFNELTDSLEKSKSDFVGQDLPGPLATLLGNERINVHVQLQNEGKIVVAIVTENDKLTRLDFNTLEDPSLDVYVDDKTLDDIQKSNNPLSKLQTALDDGKLTYKAVGFWNKIKFSAISMFVKITGGLADTTEVINEEESSVEVEDNEINEEVTENIPEEKSDDEEVEESVEEKIKEDEQIEETEETELVTKDELEEVKEDKVEVEKNKDQIVEITNDGFSPDELKIKVGETVVWKNVRSGKFKKAMIVGAQKCTPVRSKFYLPGEEFSWTFSEPLKCTIVDGMVTTQTMKLTVE